MDAESGKVLHLQSFDSRLTKSRAFRNGMPAFFVSINRDLSCFSRKGTLGEFRSLRGATGAFARFAMSLLCSQVVHKQNLS